VSNRYRTILVCLDTSPRAPGVLGAALDIAPMLGAKLILFRSVGIPQEIPESAVGHAPGELGGILMTHARRDLEERARHIPLGLVQKITVKIGIAWQSICAEARDERVDLIVIGSHGFSGLDRLLGTTAARIVNHADRSVFVARDLPQALDSYRVHHHSTHLA
jgi:nucleotide-binding universal stress UspA family protein